jgi:DNA replication regulator SLD3
MKKSASMSAFTSRPRAVTKRPGTTNSRRTLQRVLTDERQALAGSRGPSGAISLMRSATAPIVPGLKREASETPSLSSIPLNDSQNFFASRAGVQKSKRFSQREVDLGAFKGIADPKPKISIEAELKDAISALKRPNRQLAGQSIVEMAEKRVIAASLNSRKSKKPVRNPLFSGVQIMATPKNNRYKDMVGESQSQPKDIYEADAEVEPIVIPPSSLPRIPESAVRPNAGRNLDEGLLCEATPLKPRSELRLPAIQETPLKMASFSGFTNKPSSGHIAIPPSPSPPPSRSGSSAHYLRIPSSTSFEAPRAKRKENQIIFATPVKNAQSTIDEFVTPLKPLNLTSNPEAPPAKTGFLEEEKPIEEGSIYKALGWDDMDDF